MDKNRANQALLLQVRTGHRLLAAFYQRLYSNLNKISAELNLHFYAWRPAIFDRPANLTVNPFEKWQWDLLPALSSVFIFKTDFDNNKIEPEHYILEIKVDLDTAIDGKPDLGGQPDALKIKPSVEESKSIISFKVYSPFQEMEGNWYYDLWCKCSDFPLTTKPQELADFPIITTGFEVNIEKLLEDEGLEVLISRVKEIVHSTSEASKEKFQS
ncbi:MULTISPECIES: hypothetical protein [Pseudoalteromonas]|uniref:hypothetical protein n=1 Tax=Pseudoalteromonas TaxID=53246 RepID=UPI0015829BFB|nr:MULTISPECIES: hypothetical protein [Pseudoalteromonas]MDI4650526.1 hypothetical protein [Pseudoalteromonas shioyasakiensis]NUJ36945.1 hypothetical protein [Pseudoalteromonas sp. 0303]